MAKASSKQEQRAKRQQKTEDALKGEEEVEEVKEVEEEEVDKSVVDLDDEQLLALAFKEEDVAAKSLKKKKKRSKKPVMVKSNVLYLGHIRTSSFLFLFLTTLKPTTFTRMNSKSSSPNSASSPTSACRGAARRGTVGDMAFSSLPTPKSPILSSRRFMDTSSWVDLSSVNESRRSTSTKGCLLGDCQGGRISPMLTHSRGRERGE